MYIEHILKQVSKPSRYIPIEKNPFVINEEFEKIALLNAGNYESSITSLFFQSLYHIVMDSKWARPVRYFRPENDYLSLLLESENKTLNSIDNEIPLNDCDVVFTYLNGDDSVFDYVLLNKTNNLLATNIVFQESSVINPLVKKFADFIIIGNEPFKLKQILANSKSIEGFKSELETLSNDKIILLDELKGFGSATKFIVPYIDVKNSNN